MKAIYKGAEQNATFGDVVIPVYATIKQKVKLTDVSGSLQVRLYNSTTLVKSIPIIYNTTTKTAEIDLSVFSQLLPVVDFSKQFDAQKIEVSDSASTFNINVLNQCAYNYNKLTSTDRKSVTDKAEYEFFSGKKGEVINISTEAAGKENLITNSLSVLKKYDKNDAFVNFTKTSDIAQKINSAKKFTMSFYADVNVNTPAINMNVNMFIVIDNIWHELKFDKSLCGIYYEEFEVKSASVISDFGCVLRGEAIGIVKDFKLEIGGYTPFIPSKSEFTQPTSYTIGSGVGYPIKYVRKLTIDGKGESISYERKTGILCRWQNEHGGSDYNCFESYKMQDQYDKFGDANQLSEILIQLEDQCEKGRESFFNFLYKSSIIELFNETTGEWVAAKCTNKNGAVFNNADNSSRVVITLSVDKWN